MDVHKEKIKSDGSLDKLKLRILLRGYLQNKDLIGDTCYPTASMTTLKYSLADASQHKSMLHQLVFIGSFLKSNTNNSYKLP